MITYNGLDLFSSGPTRTTPGALDSRDAVMDAPGAIGAMVVGQGVSPRTIIQQGQLIADDETQLRGLIDAIEAQLGQGAADLIDEHGDTWPGCVLRSFKHSSIDRLGPRRITTYTAEYLQTSP